MATIKQPITELMQLLRAITVTNGDGSVVSPHVRIWNDQLKGLMEGTINAFPLPALFVETITGEWKPIGQGFRLVDLQFKVHIIHEYYDAQDGTFEQDLEVYDLRSKVIGNITDVKLIGCGSSLVAVDEQSSFNYSNLYEYTITFITDFTDSTGSKFDTNHPKAFIDSAAPTELQLTTFIIN